MAGVHRFEHEAMSTTFEILIAGQEASYARQVAGEVFREIDRLEGVLSRFEPGSDIALLNRLLPGQYVNVGIEVIECLDLAWRLRQDTNGAFDVSFAARPAGSEVGVVPTGLDWLVLLSGDGETDSPAGFTVGIRPEAAAAGFSGARIDLGGIGKGYALDKVTEILADWEVENVLLHSGTSTALALGSMSGETEGWPLGIGGEWGSGAGMQQVLLRNQALSGSGTEVRGQHIIDPRTGEPAGTHVGAWVAAPSAAVSDALSTAFFVMSPEEVEAYCRTHPDILAFVVRSPEGREAEVRIFGSWSLPSGRSGPNTAAPQR